MGKRKRKELEKNNRDRIEYITKKKSYINYIKKLNKLRLEKTCPFVNGECIGDKCLFYFEYKEFYKDYEHDFSIDETLVGCSILCNISKFTT